MRNVVDIDGIANARRGEAPRIEHDERASGPEAAQVDMGLAITRVVRDATEMRRDLRHVVQEALERRLGRRGNGLTINRRNRARRVEIPALDARAGDNNFLNLAVADFLFDFLRRGSLCCQYRGNSGSQCGDLERSHVR